MTNCMYYHYNSLVFQVCKCPNAGRNCQLAKASILVLVNLGTYYAAYFNLNN